MHKYRLTSAQFSQIMAKARFHADTRTTLRKILVDGSNYEIDGNSKQFIYKKIQRVKSIAESIGINITIY